MFEEGEGVEAVAEGGVEVEEVDSDDAVGLVGEDLSPGRARPARGRVNAGCVEDLPDGRGANRVPESGQFALDSPMSSPGVLLG